MRSGLVCAAIPTIGVSGGVVQQADAADGARRLGVARFARQSSLMRAPQLIRGVVRTPGGDA